MIKLIGNMIKVGFLCINDRFKVSVKIDKDFKEMLGEENSRNLYKSISECLALEMCNGVLIKKYGFKIYNQEQYNEAIRQTFEGIDNEYNDDDEYYGLFEIIQVGRNEFSWHVPISNVLEYYLTDKEYEDIKECIETLIGFCEIVISGELEQENKREQILKELLLVKDQIQDVEKELNNSFSKEVKESIKDNLDSILHTIDIVKYDIKKNQDI